MRTLGTLLHITSLYGRDLIGTLKDAVEILDTLKKAHIAVWQMLPICPVGYGASPYSSTSLFAGNIMFIDLDLLLEEGLLTKKLHQSYFNMIEERKNCKHFSAEHVDYSFICENKIPLLLECASNFLAKLKDNSSLKIEYETFCEKENYWLDAHATFTVLSQDKNMKEIIALFKASNDTTFKKEKKNSTIEGREGQIEKEKVLQFLFFRQWETLRQEAKKKGISLLGDLPIYPSYNSSDVAQNSNLFYLDEKGDATLVAGVPPDYFSPEGQLWGNPLYNWEKMKESGYDWWIKRIKHNLYFFDILRLDHFRGFHSFWAVPAGQVTAKNGSWIPAGAKDFFSSLSLALQKELGLTELPIIAEDLGIITQEVISLKNKFNLKGMKILQFAFNEHEYKSENVTNPYLPHNIEEKSVVYTGTHDNDTTKGWVEKLKSETRDFIRKYLGLKNISTDEDIVRGMIRACLSSRAELAIVPIQDFCLLGSESRMNIPGTAEGNWQWRMRDKMLKEDIINDIADTAVIYGRYNKIG